MPKYPDKMNGFEIDNSEKTGTLLFEPMIMLRKKKKNDLNVFVEHKWEGKHPSTNYPPKKASSHNRLHTNEFQIHSNHFSKQFPTISRNRSVPAERKTYSIVGRETSSGMFITFSRIFTFVRCVICMCYHHRSCISGINSRGPAARTSSSTATVPRVFRH